MDEVQTTAGSPVSPRTDVELDPERMESEFEYVVGRIAQHDVMLDGEVVVPAGKEVTTADAAGALAAGVLEDLAFAVSPGDYAKTGLHGMPESIEGTFDPEPTSTSLGDTLDTPDTDAPIVGGAIPYATPMPAPPAEPPTPGSAMLGAPAPDDADILP